MGTVTWRCPLANSCPSILLALHSEMTHTHPPAPCRGLWCQPRSPLQNGRIHPPSCRQCPLVLAHCSVPFWESPLVECRFLIQSSAPFLGVVRIQSLANEGWVQGPHSLTLFEDNSEGSPQLQSSPWSWLRGLHPSSTSLLPRPAAFSPPQVYLPRVSLHELPARLSRSLGT